MYSPQAPAQPGCRPERLYLSHARIYRTNWSQGTLLELNSCILIFVMPSQLANSLAPGTSSGGMLPTSLLFRRPALAKISAVSSPRDVRGAPDAPQENSGLSRVSSESALELTDVANPSQTPGNIPQSRPGETSRERDRFSAWPLCSPAPPERAARSLPFPPPLHRRRGGEFKTLKGSPAARSGACFRRGLSWGARRIFLH